MAEKDVAERVQKLTAIDQNLQNLLQQRQQHQSTLVEVENALEELSKTDKAYKIVGNLMVASPKENLKKELDDKKEILELRMKSIEKQEEKLKNQAAEIRKEVFK